MTKEELAAIVGRPLPGGEYVVEPYVDWLLNDVVGAPVKGECAHPLFAYLATARGKGITWDELFAVCGATAADGPMFGEHETELFRPLRVGERVTLSGRFTTAVRKEGRRTGIFDVVGFEVEVRGEDGTVAATTRNSIVFPRRVAA